MGKLRNRAIIIGEGITEFYYFQSLRDVYKQVVFKPDYPKNTSIKELGKKIREAKKEGYTHIFCIIDMDTKNKDSERAQYKKLKAKFAKPINKPKKGISCKVEFFETHLCTELFFCYYFDYTSRSYENQESLIKDLSKCAKVKYEKTIKFFLNSKGLHSYFERKGGSLKKAIANAEKSMKEKDDRDYTYSELGRLMKALENLQK